MRNAFLVMMILVLGFGCSERYKLRKQLEVISKCKNNWQYFKLNGPTKGVVLLHSKGLCSYMHLHANTIVIVNKADTIRVDGPCYTENTHPSDSVLISPYETDSLRTMIGDGKYDCIVMKTCHGIIKKI
jgi:hypothetical protein